MRKIEKIIGLIKLFFYKVRGMKISYDKTVFFHPKSKIKVKNKSAKIILKSNCNILKNVEIVLEKDAEIVIGDRVAILDRGYITAEENAKLIIKEDSFLNRESKIFCLQEITIGENVAIGTNVSMFDHDHIVRKNVKQDWSLAKKAPIYIDDNVWIGANAIILRGSKVGHNSVVGAGTVVKEEVPENTICYHKREMIYKTIEE